MAVLFALTLAVPAMAAAQTASSDLAFVRTCTAERDASQAALRRSLASQGAKEVEIAGRIGAMEDAIYQMFKLKGEIVGVLDGKSAEELKRERENAESMSAGFDFNANLPAAMKTYAECVFRDVRDYYLAEIDKRLASAPASAAAAAAPSPEPAAPAQADVQRAGRPVTPDGAPCMIFTPTGGGDGGGTYRYERYNFTIRNQCKAEIRVRLAYNGTTDNVAVPGGTTLDWHCNVGFVGSTDCPAGKVDASADWAN